VSTIRATHSVMMSRLVISVLVGYQYANSGVRSGQPSVLCGQRAEENQVSRTSGSCWKPAPSMNSVASESRASRMQINKSSFEVAPDRVLNAMLHEDGVTSNGDPPKNAET